ncbi:hypothetical protein L484_011384 [Morus notabilis]|uniref:Uncharacterized protein n=1 Tax=Morus notabilis TaxID=981085 RepID=W9QX86_9ROSA|nr:uncharacterized protein LOC21394645 [Morus notabilis]EXB57297.1 hypothetical protein L484_011384 [Morus notabilis]
MEGLLPMVFKAIKRNRSRRKYRCLSSGAAESYMSISEDYYVEPGPHTMSMMMRTTSACSMPQIQKMKAHRRHKSVGDYAFGMSTPETIHNTIRDDGYDDVGVRVGNKKAQLVRFSSRRFRMFSCVGGSN